MGYSCSIRHKDGSEYKVAMNPIGGTYMVNPPVPTEAWFSITFNYCRIGKQQKEMRNSHCKDLPCLLPNVQEGYGI